jgi:hypothetical protein
MLPPLRIAVASSSAACRALLASGLRAARLGAEDADDQAFAPAWQASTVEVAVARWASDDFDILTLDDEVWRCFERHGRCELRITGAAGEREGLAESALQIALRYQRFDGATNPASATPLFRQVLTAHERLHDRRRPLGAADHDHALDTWRWLLRLEPAAGLSLQVAALFHDVQRGDTEATHLDVHTHDSARVVVSLLESLHAPREIVEHTRALVAAHDGGRVAPDLATEAALLANVDALSFFSLNAPAFAKYYGPAHAARKVAFTVGRLDGAGRAWLSRLKLPGAFRALIREALAQPPVAAAHQPPPAAFDLGLRT